MMPKVSVLMPCYNAAKYIAEAIDSILTQTFADFELVIVDDGSQDASVAIITSYEDTRIRLIRHEINKGPAGAYNTALEQAHGAYLAILESDDASLPNRLETQARFLDEHPEVDVVGSFYRDMGKVKIWKFPLAHSEILGMSFFRIPVRMSTLMFRNNTPDKAPVRIDPFLSVVDDQDFVDKLMERGCLFANIPEPLVAYRRHDSSYSQKTFDQSDAKTTIIRKRSVRRWLPDCSERELELHCEIARRSLALSSKDAPAVAEWLYRLHTEAVARDVPQPDAFLRAMAAQWDQVCARWVSEGFGVAVRTFFSQPKLSKAAGLSGQAAFLARCLKWRGKLKK
jgi:GT2 family glycosyltransferase